MEPVRKTLSRKACALIEPDAWVIDDIGFVKDGAAAAVVADRKRAAIPDSKHHRPKWQMALEMIDELIE